MLSPIEAALIYSGSYTLSYGIVVLALYTLPQFLYPITNPKQLHAIIVSRDKLLIEADGFKFSKIKSIKTENIQALLENREISSINQQFESTQIIHRISDTHPNLILNFERFRKITHTTQTKTVITYRNKFSPYDKRIELPWCKINKVSTIYS